MIAGASALQLSSEKWYEEGTTVILMIQMMIIDIKQQLSGKVGLEMDTRITLCSIG